MTTMKERISNVIAWVGFSCFVALALSLIIVVVDSAREKPAQMGEELLCADIKRWNNPIITGIYDDIVDLDKCASYGEYVAQWKYRGESYGVTGLFASSVNSISAVAWQIPNYTHGVGEDIADSVVPWALPLWLISIVLNYILFGSARLFPWKKAVISEEAS